MKQNEFVRHAGAARTPAAAAGIASRHQNRRSFCALGRTACCLHRGRCQLPTGDIPAARSPRSRQQPWPAPAHCPALPAALPAAEGLHGAAGSGSWHVTDLGEKLPREEARQRRPVFLCWLVPALLKLTRPFLISRRQATLPGDQA